ncbi:MAG: hypothetical protein RLZZ293_776, partial [Pseudomonadota bacterium]
SGICSGNVAENIAMVRHTALNLLQISKNKFKVTSLKGLCKKLVGVIILYVLY